MIKFLTLFLTFFTLYGSEYVYHLPDNHTRFLHDLSILLKSTSNEIIWITPALNHPELKKNIIRSSRHNPIILIIHNLKGDPLSMVAYENVHLYRYSSRKLVNSIIIGDTFVCSINVPLDYNYMSQKNSIARCTEKSDKIVAFRNAVTPMLKHSQLYLK